jgi:hypothetical protein
MNELTGILSQPGTIISGGTRTRLVEGIVPSLDPSQGHGMTMPDIEADFTRVAVEYGPCDMVVADIEAGVPDSRVREVVELCGRLSNRG